MVRRALITLTVLLLAVTGSDLAAACASNLAAEASCCCPVEGPPPCFDGVEQTDTPMPDSDGVIETAPAFQASSVPASDALVAAWPRAAKPTAIDADPASATAPATRLLACVWLC